MKTWYQPLDTTPLYSPALLLNKELVINNIAHAIQMAGGASRLRPHVKTHKCRQVAQLMMQAGIAQFKCATFTEAAMLAAEKATDVLLAYQPVGPHVQRFINLMQQWPETRFSCLVDNAAIANALSKEALKQGLVIPVYIDLNVGMNRTGIVPDAAFELYLTIHTLKGLQFAGLHAYDGHLRHPVYEERLQACKRVFEPVRALAAAMEAHQHAPVVIIAGGSPSFSVHAAEADVVCSPGTFVYWDYGYSQVCPEQPFTPAAMLITRVVSMPAPGLICTDLGHKAVASENELLKRVYFPDYPWLKPVSQSEEHLVLQTGAGDSFKPGDVLLAIPWHICPTVALHQYAYVVDGNQVIKKWHTTARHRDETIPLL